jgi:S1-C subfamily serine protease
VGREHDPTAAGDLVNLVDVVLLGLVVFSIYTGWRNGLVAGVLSFIGFLGGALAGAYLAPHLVGSLDGVVAAVLGIGVVVLCAGFGNVLASMLARVIRERVTWKPVRFVDSAGGSVFGALSVLLVAWVMASALVVVPLGPVSSELRGSKVLDTVDQALPDSAKGWVGGLRAALDSTGFPQAFGGFALDPVIPVDAPDPALLKDPAVRAAWGSLVKVEGVAQDCSTQVDGSGFVYANDHVMTNAHVVAGVTDPVVLVRGTGKAWPATVVYSDPQVDVAVLYVPGLHAPSLTFAGTAQRGDAAVVAGFPGGGPLDANAARIRGRISARGSDIYGHGTVTRDVYAIRGTVRPGNSGGPLLAPDGRVDGVIFAAALQDPETGYALTAAQVAPAAKAGARATKPVDTGSCATR